MKKTDPIADPPRIQQPCHRSEPRSADHEAQDDNQLAICVLASGSKGNAIYIANQSTAILIDAGLSGTGIVRRLQSQNIHPESLRAIVVTHEHSDHTQGVGVLSRRFRLPVYMTPSTHRACPQLGRLNETHYFQSGATFQIDALDIHAFAISHDAHDPVGFVVSSNGIKLGVATDLGTATLLVKTHLKNCDALVLEANHDPEMLINGPYPWPLKQRIQSRLGHLSNSDTGDLLAELKHDQLQHIIFAHLSETNNTPQKVLEAVRPTLCDCDTQIDVARQDRCSKLIQL